MPPKKSEKPVDRVGAKSFRDVEEQAPAPQKLNLGCGTLVVAIAVIALLGKFLPHDARRSAAAAPAAASAAKPAAKPTAKNEVPKDEPRRVAATPLKPVASPSKMPPPPEPARPNAAKLPEKPAPREGAVIFNDPWTGAVSQVERYLKRSLYDASSFEALEWGPVSATGKGYKVRCTYRAKNVLGVYATQTRTFLLNRNGEVYAVREKE
jgi:hypothetical protein